jgi:Ser/Thr protein kinase RdoA (MazF antagonist)
MIAVESPPLQFDLEMLAAHYDLGELQPVRTLAGGMFASPLLVQTERGLHVCRRQAFRSTAAAFRFQAEAIASAAQQGVLCARVACTRGGDWSVSLPGAQGVIAIHQYVEGHCEDWNNWHARKLASDGFLYRLGQRVAAMHDALTVALPAGDARLPIGLPPIQFAHLASIRHEWQGSIEILRLEKSVAANEAREALLTLMPRIEAHWSSLEENLRQLQIGSLPRQIVHGDISPVNLVFSAADEPYFIDWDCVHVGYRLYDALGDVLNRRCDDPASSNQFSAEEVRAYLEGYDATASVPLSDAERRLVPAFCLARQLEDLRQRLFALPTLAASLDAKYARLIARRVAMMDQIKLN